MHHVQHFAHKRVPVESKKTPGMSLWPGAGKMGLQGKIVATFTVYSYLQITHNLNCGRGSSTIRTVFGTMIVSCVRTH